MPKPASIRTIIPVTAHELDGYRHFAEVNVPNGQKVFFLVEQEGIVKDGKVWVNGVWLTPKFVLPFEEIVVTEEVLSWKPELAECGVKAGEVVRIAVPAEPVAEAGTAPDAVVVGADLSDVVESNTGDAPKAPEDTDADFAHKEALPHGLPYGPKEAVEGLSILPASPLAGQVISSSDPEVGFNSDSEKSPYGFGRNEDGFPFDEHPQWQAAKDTKPTVTVTGDLTIGAPELPSAELGISFPKGPVTDSDGSLPELEPELASKRGEDDDMQFSPYPYIDDALSEQSPAFTPEDIPADKSEDTVAKPKAPSKKTAPKKGPQNPE